MRQTEVGGGVPFLQEYRSTSIPSVSSLYSRRVLPVRDLTNEEHTHLSRLYIHHDPPPPTVAFFINIKILPSIPTMSFHLLLAGLFSLLSFVSYSPSFISYSCHPHPFHHLRWCSFHSHIFPVSSILSL